MSELKDPKDPKAGTYTINEEPSAKVGQTPLGEKRVSYSDLVDEEAKRGVNPHDPNNLGAIFGHRY